MFLKDYSRNKTNIIILHVSVIYNRQEGCQPLWILKLLNRKFSFCTLQDAFCLSVL